jgi:hypothetical protein
MNMVTMTIVFEPSYCNVYGYGYQLRYVYRNNGSGIAVEYITGTSNLLSNLRSSQSANGTITVRCNEKDALRSVEHVYREAAAMFPADEDLLEHSGDLTRKKQLVSQERAAAKKASLEPLLPGLSGKKFAASASSAPDEDLVHPMLDMSIGEAVVPSGRRPQFTQEHSATKKVPLQAGGCENFVTIGAGLFPQIGKHARHLPAGKL